MEKNKNNQDHEETVIHPYRLQLSQKAVLYDEENQKFLLVKYRDEKSFFNKHYGAWGLVGGRVMEDEKFSEALGREIQEELGQEIEYEIIDLLSLTPVEYSTGKAVSAGYLVLYKGGEIELSEEHSEYKWEKAEDIERSSEYKAWVKDLIQDATAYIELKESLSGWRRCQADFENYKRRQEESKKELSQYLKTDLLSQIIPVVDNFHASTEHIPDNQKDTPWVVGIMHIQKQLETVLSDNGVSEIPVHIGDKFNPEIHEAIQNAGCKQDDEECENRISKVVMKGYKMGDRIIRAARVVVE